MAMADFLKDLPTRDADNFTKINPDSCHRSSTGKKTAYVPTKDIPSDQVIVTEKTNILLRYLHQQWDKKTGAKKRTGELIGEVGGKKARLETIPDTSNTGRAGAGAGAEGAPPPAYPGTSAQPNRFANQQ